MKHGNPYFLNRIFNKGISGPIFVHIREFDDKKGIRSIPARYRSLLENTYAEELILFTVAETQYIQGCGNNYINRLLANQS